MNDESILDSNLAGDGPKIEAALLPCWQCGARAKRNLMFRLAYCDAGWRGCENRVSLPYREWNERARSSKPAKAGGME